jgi:hypothetical protein
MVYNDNTFFFLLSILIDEPDRELNCVGYWMEDMLSYMVTYDEEDAVTPFRCWVCEAPLIHVSGMMTFLLTGV